LCGVSLWRERLRPDGAYVRVRRPPTNRKRIKTYVRGFDEVLVGGVPEGYVVLVSGAPGTMKSSLTYSILYQNALQEGRKSAYFTLEQGKDLTMEHMASMGMADERASQHITTLDMGNIRKNLSYLQGRGSWLELFKMYCKNVMKSDEISVLVVDSLDVLETMAKMQEPRSELYFLFEWLRDLGPLTFLISEKPLELGTGSAPAEEAYLADGIIALEMHPTSDLYVQRRLRVVKMRATKHDTGYYALSFDDGSFEVARSVTGMA
jgi:KaiC/GvpD/RAD55 family RecA-like ATPase